MPGDESREEAEAVVKSPTDAGRTRGGPRHAAPRKPLLTRLHLPAGKAIAMAAMPSAVLMGMGLTPQLATAKPLPKNPFRDGPCVSAPDKETEAEKKEKEKERAAKEKAAEEKAAKEKAAKEKAAAKPDGDASSDEGSAGSDSGSDSDSGSSDGTSSGPKPDPDQSEPADPEPSDPGPAPEPEPEDDEEWNPLDPLGLGEKLWELLTPEEKKKEREKAEREKAKEREKEKPESEPEKPEPEREKPEPEPEPEKSEPEPEQPDSGGSDDAGKQRPDAPAPGQKSKDPAASDKDDKDDKGAKADEDGKKPFPCVEEKKVDGDDEQTPVTLPNQPWYLEATSLALHDLDYEGVVNVKMANGKTKQALKFTSSGLDIGDLHQIVAGPEGTNYHVEAAKGSTSTIRNGRVTMYTERLEGNLFGLIPIVFDPEHPPPLNVPEAYFTKVKVTQAGQFGGTLTIPGLHQSITK